MPIHLLLVDDDEDDATTFSDALKQLAVPVDLKHCWNGHSALQQLADLKSTPPDIIFLDVNMPVMSGWECLREIKKIAVINQTPLIMYSSANLKQQGIQPADVGATAFYQKADRFEDLKVTLTEILTIYVADRGPDY